MTPNPTEAPMDKDGLLPCPICNGPSEFYGMLQFRVQCSARCVELSRWFNSHEEAAAAWNTRASASASAQREDRAAQDNYWRAKLAEVCNAVGMDPYAWNNTDPYTMPEIIQHIMRTFPVPTAERGGVTDIADNYDALADSVGEHHCNRVFLEAALEAAERARTAAPSAPSGDAEIDVHDLPIVSKKHVGSAKLKVSADAAPVEAVAHMPNAEFCPHCNPCRNSARLAKAERYAEDADAVLRMLMSYLAAGGMHGFEWIDPKRADEAIRWGIDHMLKCEFRRGQALAHPAPTPTGEPVTHDLEMTALHSFANAEGLNITQRVLLRQAIERLQWCDEEIFRLRAHPQPQAVGYREPTIDDAVEVLRLSYDHVFQPGEPNIILAALQSIGCVIPTRSSGGGGGGK